MTSATNEVVDDSLGKSSLTSLFLWQACENVPEYCHMHIILPLMSGGTDALGSASKGFGGNQRWRFFLPAHRRTEAWDWECWVILGPPELSL